MLILKFFRSGTVTDDTFKLLELSLKDLQKHAYEIGLNTEKKVIPTGPSAADMIKIAMINIQNWLKSTTLETKMMLQVHDELLFDVPKNEIEIVQSKVKELMESAMTLDVPILVETGVGNNWLEAH